MKYLRSGVFIVLCGLSVIPWCVVVVLAFVLPHQYRFALTPSFAHLVNKMLKFFCNIDVCIEGREHLPATPCVVLIKHSSPWETLAQLAVFPRHVIVLKRELMWVPLFGWALASLRSISINRKGGGSAVRQVLEQGQKHLEDGTWVMIFPEGTRVPKGRIGRFGLSGAALAIAANVPVIPVAHNAGDHWPSGKLLKIPGTIVMRIGEPISSSNKKAEDLSKEAILWMDQAMREISTSHGVSEP